MKMLLGLLALAISFSTLASSGESKSFTFDGTQNSIQLLLKGDKTHTEYRIESRHTTCFRTELVGYRQVCSGGYGGPRGPRGPRGPMNCYQQPVYRQVAYSCVEQVRIPFEVKDFDVEASVLLDVSKLASATASPSERFVVTLNGDDLTLTAVGSKKFFIVLKKQDIRTRMNGSVKFIDGLYATELIEAAPVLNALKMTNISLEDEGLTVKMGPVATRENIAFSLNIVKKRALASDTVLLDRELSMDETVLTTSADSAIAVFDITKLGVELSGGKFSLTAKAYLKAAGPVLNASQYGDSLETSRTLIYSIR
jgi:hypothetical protein